MLDLPSTGFAASVEKHNVKLESMCDWLEGSIVFSSAPISKSEIADMLIEEEIYFSQDFAKEHIENAFEELRRRSSCLGAVSPYKVEKSKIIRLKPWKKTPAFAFCLMASLRVLYRSSFKEVGNGDYLAQGSLFERLTADALELLGWSTHSVAWSKEESDSITERIEKLSAHLGEEKYDGAVKKWTEQHIKDGGLDIVCHRPFEDRWSGRPVLFIQCASGEGWAPKRGTPILALWNKLLDLATKPQRGIAIPFSLLADDFRRGANYDDLFLLMDRVRLSAPIKKVKANWLEKGLAKELNTWTKSRIAVLPHAD